jgi:DNA invertase Pin-like site-specific DNA recombinase
MTDYLAPPRDLHPGSYVWAYLRDSGGPTQEQSVFQQEAEIRAYCRRHGLVLSQLFKDTARSAGSVIGRETFNDLITASNDADLRPAAILIWNFARFARDLDDSSYYKAVLRKRGVIVHALTDPIPEGHMGRTVETLIDIANEEKRRQTSRDVKRGIASLVKRGYAPGGGRPPRGYKPVKVTVGAKRDGTPRIMTRWVPDPIMWDLVRLAWQMRAQGKSHGEIQEATARKVHKSDTCWPTFFSNKAYLGIGVSGDLEVPQHHEPAITWEVWQAVQDAFRASPS